MRVSVDSAVCTGHGRCYVLAPEVFHADDDGYCTIPVADVPVALEAQALKGQANCPEGAITCT
ncbi:MAG TPA: ferredoxin [Acidimicrobiales bacterium]